MERSLKVILGVCVAIFLVLLSLSILFLLPGTEAKQVNNYYVQSNNVNSNINVNYPQVYVEPKVVKTSVKTCNYVRAPYHVQEEKVVSKDFCNNDWKYSSSKYHEISKGIFGNKIDEYSVKVENKDYDSGYFTVKFYLRNSCGDERVKSVRKYISPGEKKVFGYKDIKSSYSGWRYEVVPESKKNTACVGLRSTTKYQYKWKCDWKQ
jgi:hypothetical protein